MQHRCFLFTTVTLLHATYVTCMWMGPTVSVATGTLWKSTRSDLQHRSNLGAENRLRRRRRSPGKFFGQNCPTKHPYEFDSGRFGMWEFFFSFIKCPRHTHLATPPNTVVGSESVYRQQEPRYRQFYVRSRTGAWYAPVLTNEKRVHSLQSGGSASLGITRFPLRHMATCQ